MSSAAAGRPRRPVSQLFPPGSDSDTTSCCSAAQPGQQVAMARPDLGWPQARLGSQVVGFTCWSGAQPDCPGFSSYETGSGYR